MATDILHWKHLRSLRRKPSPETLLKRAGLFQEPIDVLALAERMGVDVWLMSDHGYSGVLVVGDDTAEIYVKESDAHVRQRFTIAHELGHLVLHNDKVIFRDTRFVGDRREKQANRYAAGLLMPEELLESYVFIGMSTDEIADAFDVSGQAMQYRLTNLFGE